ncbi:glutamate decarboxylase [Syncephalastrum racemosum]|uniref:Glutamate decarboxylase n=1 Tax=Syncephalastrum racemosum TaxID=13706 RepID=A0A1X2HQM2_SYNRA|nr:glutamate decarboxylase [Syncephalastrum racemosum]
MVFLSNAVSQARIEESTSKGELHHDAVSTSVYGTRWASEAIPRYDMPQDEMPSNVAYRLIKDELAVRSNGALVSNILLQNRCVNMIARLFNAPMHSATEEALGCSTVGSSEAIILATLAMKRRWQHMRRAKGLSTEKPNMVLGSNCQVAWHKALLYLEIEPREIDCTEDLLYMDPKKAVDQVDENTIGVCAILGSTYTGHYEDVKGLHELLEAKCSENGYDVGIHVDAASGGFVAPFVNPDLEWDFRLKRVYSINVSGHKYGLTYPGVGWALWRSAEYLPKDLIFNINYLGSDQASFTLNFSKGAAQIIGQYYVLIRLGRTGFEKIMRTLTATADHLAERLEATGRFTILSAGQGQGLPLVAFRLNAPHHYDEFDIAARLRERGWIVPAYTMAPKLEHLKMLRVVVREDFSRSRCEILVRDIIAALKSLDTLDEKAVENLSVLTAENAHTSLHKNPGNYIAEKTAEEQDGKKAKQAPGIC